MLTFLERLSHNALPENRKRETLDACIAVHFGDLGEILIVFWTRKGKSLNFIQLFSMFRE